MKVKEMLIYWFLFIMVVAISASGQPNAGISSKISIERIVFPKEPSVYCYGPNETIHTAIFFRSDISTELMITEIVRTYSVDKKITVTPGVSYPIDLELKLPKSLEPGIYFLTILITPLNQGGKPITVVKDDAICISNGDDAEAWFNEGTFLAGLGKYDEAIKAFDEAIRLDPNYVDAWSNKGNAFKLLGRTTEADVAFAKAKELGYAV